MCCINEYINQGILSVAVVKNYQYWTIKSWTHLFHIFVRVTSLLSELWTGAII